MSSSMSPTDEYRPLDLSPLFNRSTFILEDPQDVSLGARRLHGIPFGFADPAAANTLLLLEKDGAERHASVPVNAHVRWLIFAHAILEPELYERPLVGVPCAEYVLRYADGTETRRQIRTRFEIGPTPRKWTGRAIPLDWGQTPFLALNDSQHALMDRCCGRYDAAGGRLVDIEDPQSRVPYVLPYRFYLWPWANPHPDKEVASVELVSQGTAILIGGITVSSLEEDPFGRGVSRDVLVTLHDRPMDESVAVTVDRGFTTYTYRLAAGSLEAEPDFPKGWGAQRRADDGAGYVKIAAQPSATVEVRAGGQLLGRCRWSALTDAGEVALGAAVTLTLGARDRTWVRTRIVDAATGERLACRVHFRGMDGVPFAPYGHHAHLMSDGNTWNLDIGGDVRLGAQTHAHIDGECEGWMPVGQIIVEVARGFGYRPLLRLCDITADTRELCVQLERFSDPRQRGYMSGDTHVHFVSTQGAELEARAEDVDVVNLLLTQWGHTYSNTEEFTGRPHVSADRRTIVFACQENRTNMLGHLSLLGVKSPILPWCTGGSEEADLGGGLETTLSHWADECHAVGGTVVLAHFPVPNGESAALIATGRLDAVEMIAYDDYNVAEYYRYLNCGYRLPLVAGTDKMTAEVPIGLIRTFVRTAEPRDYWAWCAGIKSGDTYVSSGPLLSLNVDGQAPGALLTGRGRRRVEVRAAAESVFPIDRLEIVCNGAVLARHRSERPGERLELACELEVNGDSWVIARCYAPGDAIARHHDVWRRPVMAHTSPVYIARDMQYDPFDAEMAQYMLNMVEGSRLYILERARTEWPGVAAHRHRREDHRAFLLAPLEEARAMLQARIETHGGVLRR